MPRKRTEKDVEYDKARAGTRSRNWAALGYPESMAPNWRDLLLSMAIPCFVSPLHDQDVWTAYDEADNPDHEAGEHKKDHYHFQFLFSSVKTAKQVEELIAPLGLTHVIKVEDAKAYARYLCHTGAKDKHQYDRDAVMQFGGADYAEMVEGTSDKVKAIREMEEWCEEQGVTSYRVLSKYCREQRPDWYRVLVWNGRHIMDVLKSAEWEARERAKAQALASATKVDPPRPPIIEPEDLQ